jgi:hypothetical protein
MPWAYIPFAKKNILCDGISKKIKHKGANPMFCTQCGKQNAESLKFCVNCGAPISGSADGAGIYASEYDDSRISYGSQQATSHFEHAHGPPSYADLRKKMTFAVTTALAMLTIITMLCSWLTFTVRMPPELMGTMPLEMKYSMTVFELANTLKLAGDMLDEAIRDANRRAGSRGGPSASDIRQLVDISNGAKAGYSAINVIRAIIVITVLLLLAFIFLMLMGKNYCIYFGQIGLIAAFASAVIFAVSSTVLNTVLTNIMLDMYAPRDMLAISGPGWLYLTMLLCVLTFVFITVRKPVVKGEQ